MFRPFACALAALLLVGGVASAQTAVPFSTLAQGARGSHGPARTVVIRSELDLRRSGVSLTAGAVDFRSEMVLAVFMGEQRSTGYSITVAGVERKMLPRPTIFPPPPAQYVLNVDVVVRKPARGSIQASIMTSPYHLVKLARSKDRVEFKVRDLFVPPLTGVRPTAKVKAPTLLVCEDGRFLCFVPKGASLTVLQADDGTGRAQVQYGDKVGFVKGSRLQADQADAAQADAAQANTGQADPAPSIGLAGSVPNQ